LETSPLRMTRGPTELSPPHPTSPPLSLVRVFHMLPRRPRPGAIRPKFFLTAPFLTRPRLGFFGPLCDLPLPGTPPFMFFTPSFFSEVPPNCNSSFFLFFLRVVCSTASFFFFFLRFCKDSNSSECPCRSLKAHFLFFVTLHHFGSDEPPSSPNSAQIL